MYIDTKYMDTVSLVEHSILRVKVLDALLSNNAAMVLRLDND